MRPGLAPVRRRTALAVHLLLLLAWLFSQHAGLAHALAHSEWRFADKPITALAGVERHSPRHDHSAAPAATAEEHSCLLVDAATLAVAASIPVFAFLPTPASGSAPLQPAPYVLAPPEFHGPLPRGPPRRQLILA